MYTYVKEMHCPKCNTRMQYLGDDRDLTPECSNLNLPHTEYWVCPHCGETMTIRL